MATLIDWVLIYCIALGLAGGIPVGAILQARLRSKEINRLMQEAISNAEKIATPPTAAEVIGACEKALEEVLDALRDDMPLDAAMAHGDTALALIAKWKEVQ